jgi:signal transduction histidine kinase
VRRWRGFGSVRFRLTVLATAVFALALVGASVALVASQRHSLTNSVDLSLSQRADNLSPGLRADPGVAPLIEPGDPEDGFEQLLDARGRIVRATDNARGLPAVVHPRTPGAGVRIGTQDVSRLSASDFRVLAQPLTTTRGPMTLVVAKNLDDVEESVSSLRSALLLWVPIVVVLLAGLLWWLTGRVLLPVEAIRAEVSAMGAKELHRRVPVSPRDDEITRLARTMNEMLDRIELATARQQQFVADASHELRSPLTRLRTRIELALAHPEGDTEATTRELLADVVDLGRLLDDLLLSVRLESEPARRHEPVDLDDLVLAEALRLRTEGGAAVDTSDVGAARVEGDPGELARMVRNLADNAARHAASMVRFGVREYDGVSAVTVTDDGPGIRREDHDRIFERFARLDESRSRDEGGTGLGLAIVHDIVERHDGTVTIDSAPGSGTRFIVELPRLE